MFPDEDEWEGVEWDEYGAALDLSAFAAHDAGSAGENIPMLSLSTICCRCSAVSLLSAFSAHDAGTKPGCTFQIRLAKVRP